MDGDELKCPVGCRHYAGGEIQHQKECPHYPESLSERADKRELALNEIKLVAYTLSRALKRRELTASEQKLVNGADHVFRKHFDVTDVLR